jgi:hypothetical protein
MKKYADGGGMPEDVDAGEGGGLPPLKPSKQKESTYVDKLQDFYLKKSDPSLRNKRIPDLTLKDVAGLPKEAALLAGLIPGIAAAGTADMAVGAKNFVKERIDTKRKLNAMPEEFSEPVDMSTPRPPRRELNADQKRSIAKEKDLKTRYGMKKGGSVSASKRADGCAVRGKTKGMMR